MGAGAKGKGRFGDISGQELKVQIARKGHFFLKKKNIPH